MAFTAGGMEGVIVVEEVVAGGGAGFCAAGTTSVVTSDSARGITGLSILGFFARVSEKSVSLARRTPRVGESASFIIGLR